MKKVATAVAAKLNTSPAVALSAYIDPNVWEQWKRVSRTSHKSPKYSVVAAKAKKIDKLLADRFRARLKAVETEFANGVDVAKARAHCFLASDSRARLRTGQTLLHSCTRHKFANSSLTRLWSCAGRGLIPFRFSRIQQGMICLKSAISWTS